MKFCVIGASGGGRAMTAYLSSIGYPPILYNRSFSRIHEIKKAGGIVAEGALEGFFPVGLVTQNLGEAVKNADVVLVVTPAFAHKKLALKMAPFLSRGQIIVLNPGRTFGAVEFRNIVIKIRGWCPAIITETQTLLFTSRQTEENGVKIFRIKNSVNYSTYPEEYIFNTHRILRNFFPQLQPVENYLETTLRNIGMLVHPAISLLHAAEMDSGKKFKFYSQGVSPCVATLLEQVEAEIQNVFDCLSLPPYDYCAWIEKSYGVCADTILDSVRQVDAYKDISSPDKLRVRYFTEDVPTGLVPVSSIAKFYGLETPTIDSIIQIASVICGINFWEQGRTVEKLEVENYLDEKMVELQPPLSMDSSLETYYAANQPSSQIDHFISNLNTSKMNGIPNHPSIKRRRKNLHKISFLNQREQDLKKRRLEMDNETIRENES